MTGALPRAMLVVGARPNLIKVAPVINAMEQSGCFAPELVHTGQHYDPAMSDVFFKDLDIRTEAINLGVGSGSHAVQTGAVMTGIETLISKRRPRIIFTFGDVNSTLAASIVAAKSGVIQAHVEAGLRSGDASMPEEVNRVVVDRLSDLLFTHSESANVNLLREGASPERIHFVGNVMIDTLLRLQPRWQGAAQRELRDLPQEYGVITLHRPANVDDPERLHRMMHALSQIAQRLPIVFPVHPRTRRHLAGTDWPGVRLVEPLGYLVFLDLVEHARIVMTDSGGIQEEATMLRVPCLTLRDNTERPVTVDFGSNRLVGADPSALPSAVDAALGEPKPTGAVPPLWDGHAAERVVDCARRWLDSPHPLRLSA
jgi:UDP-N-acetylglucosamine 2-epimerase (non-hydrolysing)